MAWKTIENRRRSTLKKEAGEFNSNFRASSKDDLPHDLCTDFMNQLIAAPALPRDSHLPCQFIKNLRFDRTVILSRGFQQLG